MFKLGKLYRQGGDLNTTRGRNKKRWQRTRRICNDTELLGMDRNWQRPTMPTGIRQKPVIKKVCFNTCHNNDAVIFMTEKGKSNSKMDIYSLENVVLTLVLFILLQYDNSRLYYIM